MAASDQSKRWDPYETSQRREFVYRPESSPLFFRPTSSKSHGNGYMMSSSGPVGSTLYTEDFSQKSPIKSTYVRSVPAIGNKRNNPHPSPSFVVWKLPKGLELSSADGRLPWKSPLTDEEIRNTLSAQCQSTYRTDYLGLPQGIKLNHTALGPLNWKRDAPFCSLTEMRHHYRKPIQNPALQGNVSRYGCSALHGVAPRGIVPTVVHKHILSQESGPQLTNYDKHYGGKSSDISSALTPLQPQELQQFCKHLLEKDSEVLQTSLSRPRVPSPIKKMKNPVVLPQAHSSPQRLSDWPGPL